jgi:hypothetical protein
MYSRFRSAYFVVLNNLKQYKMANLHDTQINKSRKIVGYTLSIIPSIMLLMSGIMKISGAEGMQANMDKIPNFGVLMLVVGLIELAALILYWLPKTSNLGFFLLASYTGGVIVAEIVTGVPPMAGIMVATLIYLGTFLRKPSLFGLEK